MLPEPDATAQCMAPGAGTHQGAVADVGLHAMGRRRHTAARVACYPVVGLAMGVRHLCCAGGRLVLLFSFLDPGRSGATSALSTQRNSNCSRRRAWADSSCPASDTGCRSLLTRPVTVLVFQYFCSSYVWYFYITWLPTYLREGRGQTRRRALPRSPYCRCVRRFWIPGNRTAPMRMSRRAVAACGFFATAILLLGFTQSGQLFTPCWSWAWRAFPAI